MASAGVRVYGPDNNFDVNGNNRNLDNNNGAFGMTFCRGFSLLMLILWICMAHYALMTIFFSLTKKQESARQQNPMLLSLRRISRKICFFSEQGKPSWQPDKPIFCKCVSQLLRLVCKNQAESKVLHSVC